VCSVILINIYTKIFAEGFRDKIFDTEIVHALGNALSNQNWWLRYNVVNIFTAAIAQGALHSFSVICISKYLQMVFGTRYLTLGSSLHLDVH